MPSSYSNVVRKSQQTAAAQPAKAQRRGKPGLKAPAAPPPVISDGATTEADLCKWASWFGRFHMDPPQLYVPISLRTVDCMIHVRRESRDDVQTMRCIREVAKFNGLKGIEWKLITWVPGLPGAQFQTCVSLEAAMSLLDAPAKDVHFRSASVLAPRRP